MSNEAIKLLAKAEALEQEAKELQIKAMQYRQEAERLMCNVNTNKPI